MRVGVTVLAVVSGNVIDMSRRVRELGTAFVDNGATISRTLAAIVSSKALYLQISLKHSGTNEDALGVEQVGLIRGERLTPSPPKNRQAVVVGGDSGLRIFFALHDTDSPSLQRPVYTTLLQEQMKSAT
jgi:hypothetical protein